jgi:hypothetical protein
MMKHSASTGRMRENVQTNAMMIAMSVGLTKRVFDTRLVTMTSVDCVFHGLLVDGGVGVVARVEQFKLGRPGDAADGHAENQDSDKGTHRVNSPLAGGILDHNHLGGQYGPRLKLSGTVGVLNKVGNAAQTWGTVDEDLTRAIDPVIANTYLCVVHTYYGLGTRNCLRQAIN